MMNTASESKSKVNLSTKRPFAAKFKNDMKEMFLSDDPFRHLRDKSHCGASWRLAKYFIPILEWAPKYNLASFWSDLLAGITIASLAIPQGISYARLAQLPPIIGLYSSFVPPLVYAIFGSSTNVGVGTTASSSLMLASMIGSHVSFSEDQELYVQLVFTAAFFTGIFQLALGLFRLGMLVDLLSKSTITGFMGGTATIVILQQLKGFLGFNHFTPKTDVISAIHADHVESQISKAVLVASNCAFAHRHIWMRLCISHPRIFCHALNQCFLDAFRISRWVEDEEYISQKERKHYLCSVAGFGKSWLRGHREVGVVELHRQWIWGRLGLSVSEGGGCSMQPCSGRVKAQQRSSVMIDENKCVFPSKGGQTMLLLHWWVLLD